MFVSIDLQIICNYILLMINQSAPPISHLCHTPSTMIRVGCPPQEPTFSDRTLMSENVNRHKRDLSSASALNQRIISSQGSQCFEIQKQQAINTLNERQHKIRNIENEELFSLEQKAALKKVPPTFLNLIEVTKQRLQCTTTEEQVRQILSELGQKLISHVTPFEQALRPPLISEIGDEMDQLSDDIRKMRGELSKIGLHEPSSEMDKTNILSKFQSFLDKIVRYQTLPSWRMSEDSIQMVHATYNECKEIISRIFERIRSAGSNEDVDRELNAGRKELLIATNKLSPMRKIPEQQKDFFKNLIWGLSQEAYRDFLFGRCS